MYVAEGELDGGVVLGSDDFVGVVTFPRQVDVSHFVVDVDAPLHSGLVCFHTTGFHVAINI